MPRFIELRARITCGNYTQVLINVSDIKSVKAADAYGTYILLYGDYDARLNLEYPLFVEDSFDFIKNKIDSVLDWGIA